ncbi:unnamed protein product [Brassica napus]|uniref:(rape) hypothetical protein n=1 Tax=Brassica napus TaxID=3708 RepID=A0A816XDD9_BRANA|nr:unnamed protein product [Brassica napus]
MKFLFWPVAERLHGIITLLTEILDFRLLEFLPRVFTFAKNLRQLQFEADINKLFMYTRLVLLAQ